ncbi:MAG TPA: hypothetical protein ENH55_19725 [Aurantimonas coralicida]|uniref:Uncharacterized protein n=1 Tax=marine sediment metagenome TaxID=412755 RepID=A0A0F9PLD5_9ZZZZ|nr:hypothetical protein [Aurantimonas coralicida]
MRDYSRFTGRVFELVAMPFTKKGGRRRSWSSEDGLTINSVVESRMATAFYDAPTRANNTPQPISAAAFRPHIVDSASRGDAPPPPGTASVHPVSIRPPLFPYVDDAVTVGELAVAATTILAAVPMAGDEISLDEAARLVASDAPVISAIKFLTERGALTGDWSRPFTRDLSFRRT